MLLSTSRLSSVLLLVCLICLPPQVQGQSAGSNAEEVLTLEEAIALALRDNLQLRNASLDVSRAEEQLSALFTKRLPSFNLNILSTQQLKHIDFIFERGVFGNFPGTGPIPAANTNIGTPLKPTAIIIGQVAQPLSQLYRVNLSLAQLKLNRELEQEQLRGRHHEITQNVKQAYFAILQTQSAMRSVNENIKFYRELDRVTGEYLVQKVALKADTLDVKTRLAKAEYDALTLSDQLAVQKQQLNRLLARDVLTEFSVSPVPETTGPEIDFAAARGRALEQRPELREARLKVKQAEGDRRVKKSEFIPDVSVSFHYLSPRNFSSFIPKNIAALGVIFSWEVFDWGRKKHELAEKDLTIEQSLNGVRDAETSILIEINDKFRKLQQTRQLLRIAQLSQEASIENVRVMTDRYQVKASLMKDVLQAQTALEQANYRYQQALLSFWMAKAELEKALGDDK